MKSGVGKIICCGRKQISESLPGAGSEGQNSFWGDVNILYSD